MIFTNLPGRLYLLSLLFSGSFAAPYNGMKDIGLVARANDGSSKSSPIEATFSIDGWEDISEENCYVMLCLYDGERVWQKGDAAESEGKYRASGASLTPFRPDHTDERGTEEINTQPGKSTDTRSAEEFPWRSMAEGGTGADLMPATITQQTKQGNAIQQGYRNANPIISKGLWFRIKFTGNLGKMCKALMQEPPDKSICKNPKVDIFGKTAVNLANFVYVAVKYSTKVVFPHAAGPNKGKSTKRMSPIEMRALQEDKYSLVEARAEGFEDYELIPIMSRDANAEDEDWDEEDWNASNAGME